MKETIIYYLVEYYCEKHILKNDKNDKNEKNDKNDASCSLLYV